MWVWYREALHHGIIVELLKYTSSDLLKVESTKLKAVHVHPSPNPIFH